MNTTDALPLKTLDPAHVSRVVRALLIEADREILRSIEESAGVGAVDGGYRVVSSSTEKSRSRIASSIRRL